MDISWKIEYFNSTKEGRLRRTSRKTGAQRYGASSNRHVKGGAEERQSSRDSRTAKEPIWSLVVSYGDTEIELMEDNGCHPKPTAVLSSIGNYAPIFYAIPIPATLIDTQGIIVDVNQAFLDLAHHHDTEIRKEDRIGRHITSFTGDAEEHRIFGAFIGELLSTGEARHLEWYHVERSGKREWADIDAQILRDTSGQVAGALILRKNITEQKEAEEALRKSEERFRDLYEKAPLAYFSVDADGRIEMVNQSAVDLLGYDKNDLISSPILDLYADTPAGKEKARKAFQRFLKGEEIRNEELEMSQADGTSVWGSLTVTPVLDTEGQTVASRSMVMDITEGKRQELEKIVLQNVRDAIWEMQGENDIEAVLKAIKEGLTALEIPFHGLGANVVEEGGDSRQVRHFEFLSAEDGGQWLTVEISTDIGGLIEMWQKGRPVYRRDLADQDIYQERATIEERFSSSVRSIIDIPFSHGTLAVNSTKGNAFSEQDIAFMESLTQGLSEGFQRLDDLRELERRVREAEALASAIAAVSGTHDMAEVLQKVVQEGATLVACERAVLFLYDEEEGFLVPRAQIGHNWEIYRRIRLQPGESSSGYVFSTGKSMLTPAGPDFSRYPLHPENRAIFEKVMDGQSSGSGATVALYLNDQVIGTLAVGGSRRQLDKRDLEILERLGEQAVLAIDRVRRTQVLEQRTRELTEEITERKQMENLLFVQRDLATALNAAPHLEEGLRLCLEAALWISGMDCGGIYLVDDTSGDLDIAFHRGLSAEFVEIVSHYDADSANVQLLMANTPIYTHYRDLGIPLDKVREQEGLRAMAVVPVCHQDHVVACLNAASHTLDETPASTRSMLEVIAGQIGSAISRLKVEKSLQESEEKFRSLTENLPIGVYRNTVGPQGHFLEANPALVRMFSYDSREELLRVSVADFYQNPEDRIHFNEKMLREGRALDEEFLLKKKDGTELIGSVTAEAIKDEKGTVLYYDGIIEDITERRWTEEQLRQSQKMEAVGQLAGGIAHDFNNMLMAILTSCDFLLLNTGIDDEQRQDLELIKEAGERAATLTQQILAFSRRQIQHPEMLDLNAVIDEMQKMLRRLISEDIGLITDLAPALEPVLADRVQFEQVLLNLVVNARDAMPQGGRLIIETANVELDEGYAVQHQDVQAGSYVMLAVSDTGVGMDTETQTHIFEPFFTTKERGKGTGMGLATVFGIVKQSRGHVWAYSEPGKGTTFKIYLPRIEEEAGSSDEEQLSDMVPHGTERVLLVEDDDLVRQQTQRILTQLGYTVLEATDGEGGLQTGTRYADQIDLLLTDVVMPGMNGRELADRLSAQIPNLKIAYMSGYTDEAISHHGMWDAGAVFITKPFSTNLLATTLRKILDT
jgi:PAS domain S-box-containing protein